MTSSILRLSHCVCFTEQYTFTSHASADRFTCYRCGKLYRHKATLYTHLRYECGKEPSFSCPHCPLRAKRKATLLLHIRRKHSDRPRPRRPAASRTLPEPFPVLRRFD
ncbi:Longitudinals lacking protein, isoform G [Frankliniella fusca]|uniref:Longitudinals lacking protein, isoform G n=1 Tax=Frankliniella fusca TaxID=407009 RepID=A0AAE1H7C5_9NEOP|nr:Longitudinals lacking protein, isoform G [Frankliniella fusca]